MHHDLKEQNTPNNTDASSVKTSTTQSTFNSNHSDLNSINSTSQIIKNGILIDRKLTPELLAEFNQQMKKNYIVELDKKSNNNIPEEEIEVEENAEVRFIGNSLNNFD